jgi:hypothetical protein
MAARTRRQKSSTMYSAQPTNSEFLRQDFRSETSCTSRRARSPEANCRNVVDGTLTTVTRRAGERAGRPVSLLRAG